MVKKGQSFLFEGKIRDFEKVILEYQLEIARFSSLSETMTKIMAYLSLYQKLTQSQLKYLTKYSKSTISTSLTTLIKINYVRKEKIKLSREYKYYIAPPSQMSIDFALGSTENEIAFLMQKIKELDFNNLEGKNGYNLILVRLKHILDVFECYQRILETLKNPKAKVNLNLSEEHIKTLSLEDFNLLHLKFDPEIKQVEDDLLEFFMYESAYSTLSEFTLMIYTLFITRKVLTQEKIRELTGLSLGKVSQTVNTLIKNRLIKKVEKEQYQDVTPFEIKRQIIYSMPSIKEAFFTSGINSLKEMLKYENKFQKIKSELVNNEENLKRLRGYTQVLNFVDKYIDIIPIYKKATSIFFNYLN